MNRYLSNQYNSTYFNVKNYLALFVLWPFLAFLTALSNYNQKEAKKVVFIFLVYYGLTFYLSNIGIDAERYALQLKKTAELPFSDFFIIVGGLYTDTTVDIFQPLVTFIVSRFTSNHGVFFAVCATVFGFFYLKSFNFLYERYRKNPGLNSLFFMLFLILIVPITDISGVRMPIAIWIFFYGAINVILYRDSRYLLLTLASSLVHWSFLTANVVLIIYYFAGNRNLFYLPVLLLSFVLPQLLSSVFESLAYFMGGPIQARYEGYTNELYILDVNESYEKAAWFMTLKGDLLYYYLLAAVIFIQITHGNLMKGKEERNLFSFLLLFLSFVNFGKAIPTFGGRFQGVFYLFAVMYIFLYFMKLPSNKISLLFLFGLFPILLDVAFSLRVGSETINAWIFAPGLGIPLFVPGLSLAQILFY